MSAFKGTPGPWEIGEALCSHAPAVIGDGDSVVCEFSGRVGASVCTDARLIAAAPDLLEALIAMVDAQDIWLGDGRPAPAAAKASARAAIAKATRGCGMTASRIWSECPSCEGAGDAEARRDAETLANARLIAAAPELLSCLEMTAHGLEVASRVVGGNLGAVFSDRAMSARAAIAKATGGAA